MGICYYTMLVVLLSGSNCNFETGNRVITLGANTQSLEPGRVTYYCRICVHVYRLARHVLLFVVLLASRVSSSGVVAGCYCCCYYYCYF